jgi:hypothetical protein
MQLDSSYIKRVQNPYSIAARQNDESDVSIRCPAPESVVGKTSFSAGPFHPITRVANGSVPEFEQGPRK